MKKKIVYYFENITASSLFYWDFTLGEGLIFSELPVLIILLVYIKDKRRRIAINPKIPKWIFLVNFTNDLQQGILSQSTISLKELVK